LSCEWNREVIVLRAHHDLVADAATDGESLREFWMDISGAVASLALHELLEARHGGGKEKRQHLRRCTGDGPAVRLEGGPTARAESVVGNDPVLIDIVNRHHRAVLGGAQRAVETTCAHPLPPVRPP